MISPPLSGAGATTEPRGGLPFDVETWRTLNAIRPPNRLRTVRMTNRATHPAPFWNGPHWNCFGYMKILEIKDDAENSTAHDIQRQWTTITYDGSPLYAYVTNPHCL